MPHGTPRAPGRGNSRSTLFPIAVIPRKYLFLLSAIPLAACARPGAPPPVVDAPASYAQQFLGFVGPYEFFVDFPVRPAGETVRFAMHVTRLADGAPLPDGRLVLRLEREGEVVECAADGPSVPGHWMPEVVLPADGLWELSVGYDGLSLRLGALLASADATKAAAAQAAGPPPSAILVLKEQQWPARIRTEEVGMLPLEERLPVVVRASPVPASSTHLRAPAFGRLESAAGATWPRLGAAVAAGELLGQVRMPLLPGDPATREATRLAAVDALRVVEVGVAEAAARSAEAEMRVGLAEAELQRVTTLHQQGARSDRELDEARAAYAGARGWLEAAEQARLAWHAAESAVDGGDPHPELVFELRAPCSGLVVQADFAPGAWVDANDELLHVVDTSRLRYGVRMHVDDLARLESPRTFVRLPRGGTLELPGVGGELLLARPPVEAGSHVGELVYEAPAPDGLLPGAVLQAQISLDEAREVLAVPAGALVDEDGLDVLFVQVGGEAFERRVVRVGLRGLEAVEILDGVALGERIVVDGAYTIRLASLSGAIPEHHH